MKDKQSYDLFRRIMKLNFSETKIPHSEKPVGTQKSAGASLKNDISITSLTSTIEIPKF